MTSREFVRLNMIIGYVMMLVMISASTAFTVFAWVTPRYRALRPTGIFVILVFAALFILMARGLLRLPKESAHDR